MDNVFYFIIQFIFSFLLTYSYMIFMNGILDSDVRGSNQIYLSALVMIVVTIAYIIIVPQLDIAFNLAIYARTLAFVLSYMLARKVVSWLDW